MIKEGHPNANHIPNPSLTRVCIIQVIQKHLNKNCKNTLRSIKSVA